MAKRKTKPAKKKAAKKAKKAPESQAPPASPPPAQPPGEGGPVRMVTGESFLRYRVQVERDKNIELESQIVALKEELFNKVSSISKLTKILSEKEQEVADLNLKLLEKDKIKLDADRQAVVAENQRVVSQLQLRPNEQVELLDNQLRITMKKDG